MTKQFIEEQQKIAREMSWDESGKGDKLLKLEDVEILISQTILATEEEIRKRVEGKIEKWASIEHERWTKWQKYMHSKLQYEEKNFGSHTVAYYLLDAGLYEHWSRQIDTPYESLTEKEKESDREQVRPYIDDLLSTLTTEKEI